MERLHRDVHAKARRLHWRYQRIHGQKQIYFARTIYAAKERSRDVQQRHYCLL